MKKNFLFGALALMLAGFWFGGASLATEITVATDCGEVENCYTSLADAIAATNTDDTVALLNDVDLNADIEILTGITLDLKGYTINSKTNRLHFSGDIQSKITGNGTITGSGRLVVIGSATDNEPKVTIENGTFVASYGHSIKNFGELTILDANVTAEYIDIYYGANSSGTIISGTFTSNKYKSVNVEGPLVSLTINDGSFKSLKDNIIFTNGTDGWGGSNIIINGGTFTTYGYAGIVASNGDDVTLNGGKFIDAGVGILARGGNIKIGEDVNINLGGYSPGETCGAGDVGITVPCGNNVVMDIAAGYPGAATFTVENELGETYVIEGTKANHTGHIVKYGDNESEKTVKLTKSGTSAKITEPETPVIEGYQFVGWFNGEDAEEAFNFSEEVSSDVELVSKWNTVISEIDITGVEKPVAGNTATTGGIKISSGLTITNAYWTEVTQAIVNQQIIQQPTSVMSVQGLQIAQVGPEPFEGTFVEGSGYVLHVLYATGDGYELAESVTYKINGENIDNETDEENAVAKTYTAAAKPASSNYSGGGGGGSSKSSASSSNESKTDEKATDTAKADEQKADDAKADENKNEAPAAEETAAPTPMTEAQAVAKFGQEQIDAYKWAHDKGITTMDTVEDARLDQPLTRAELAKMMVVYMVKIANKSPVVTGTVSYPDVKSEELGDLAGYIQLAYQFQIMGIDANGKPIDEFNPNGLVTRGEYATVFSRVLFGSLFNQEGEDFYSKHIAALNAAGILTNTDPTIQEMRGWVMLMMYRSSQNLEEIAKVAAEIGATDEEVEAGKKAAEILAEEEAKAETTTGDVAEAPAAQEQAEATTGDVAEAPAAQEQAEATTGDVAEVPAVEETASAEANTGEVAAEPSNN